jgi:hypothetical protein
VTSQEKTPDEQMNEDEALIAKMLQEEADA